VSAAGLPPPDRRLQAVVVVPARDEERRIGGCLRALAGQRGLDPCAYEVLLVLDRCQDATRERALATGARHPRLRLGLLVVDGWSVGAVRRQGMDTACGRLLAAGRGEGLIASTDADSIVDPDWLALQLALARRGARAIGGRVELDEREAAELPASVLAARREQSRVRMARVLGGPGGAGTVSEHHQFSGASMAITAQTYRDVGGLPDSEALEDEALQRALEERGITIARPDAVRVRTSARTNGRAPRGLARDLALADWRARRSFYGGAFSIAELARERRHSVSVVLPAREVADTIGPILDALLELQRRELVDEVLVVDAASRDGTAEVARAHGARVEQENDLLAGFGPARGKGDAMWRGLSATTGEIVAYLDADTANFQPRFLVGLLGPLLTDPQITFVKGAFQRPFRLGEHVMPGEGGRVTELVARPLLNLYAPELAGFDQPLAGEIGARRGLLEQLRYPAGYGVEIAMLIDALELAGIEALAQVDLGERQNRHQSLRELSAMAYAVMVAAGDRLHSPELRAAAPGPLAFPPAAGQAGMELRSVTITERPPLASLVRGALQRLGDRA
jgi:glucosyl-3-phosphoglycerate synthase